ncbi:hypothetical protein ACQEVB_02175 [Pseudonocardia sp. CA-107938]|uniref:hypothetical protein n=1 Tax=Pseudonocardia sp. CA-107938 TaxID=3240021 RepID=UPI003D8D49F3
MDAIGTPRQVRLAGAGVAAEALAGLIATVVLLTGSGTADLPVGSVVGEAALFVLGAAALGFVAWGLVTGRRWARTPAIVIQLLLLPVVYSLIGPSRELVLGVVTGLVVAGTFLLLLSEPARTWSMDLPQD